MGGIIPWLPLYGGYYSLTITVWGASFPDYHCTGALFSDYHWMGSIIPWLPLTTLWGALFPGYNCMGGIIPWLPLYYFLLAPQTQVTVPHFVACLLCDKTCEKFENHRMQFTLGLVPKKGTLATLVCVGKPIQVNGLPYAVACSLYMWLCEFLWFSQTGSDFEHSFDI